MSFFAEYAWIIPCIALLSFFLIVFGKGLGFYQNKKISMALTVGATFIGLVFSAFILIWCSTLENASFENNYYWLNIGDLKLTIGWLVDNLSAVMLVMVTSISLLIQIYSHEYMNKDEGYHRFFAYLSFFNFSMLGLVLSSNLFQMYIFWELVGVSSYLLIGFWFKRPSAANAAKKAFIMNRIGDFGFLIGIIAFLFFSFSWWQNDAFFYLSFLNLTPAAIEVLAATGPYTYALIAFGLFLGTVAKSAQVPLHTWLPDAMEGPTPISALIHAATMVAAGVFLIARVYPIYELSPVIMYIIAWTGAITALITATIAITQFDIKKALAYSTCSQLGYMVMAMGVGAYSAGLFHLITHAYFKAMLFLCSGAVIHGLAEQQDMRYMGGLRKKMPAVAISYLIGTLAISGLFLSGFWSKEEIFAGLLQEHQIELLVIAIFVAGLTSFYMFRTYFMTFEGEYKGSVEPHNASKTITLPLLILAVPSALLGFVYSGSLKNFGIGAFSDFVYYVPHSSAHAGIALPVISILVALLGAIIAAAMYWDKFRKFFKLEPEIFVENLKPFYVLSRHRWFFDDVYNWFIQRLFFPLAKFLSCFDKLVIDGIVNLSAKVTYFCGYVLRLFQNGNVQTYATILLGGLTLLLITFLAYWMFPLT